MKIDRLIGIITILLRQDKATAPELAKRFEVSRRTINRDIEDICKAGIPLVTTQGRGGGISIAEGYKIDSSLFTEDELQAVFAGLKGMDSVSESSLLRDVLEKLSPKSGQISLDDAIVIDLASYYRPSLTWKIEQIKTAIHEHRLISFSYYYEKGENRRTIEPYRIVFKWSSWYVWGYCLERGDFRLFKLNRLWNLEPGTDTFTARELPAEGLDFEKHFIDGSIHLKARFAESEKYRLIEEYGTDSFTEENGQLLFERNFAGYRNMSEWILSFGDKAEVLEPKELREDIRRQAENILGYYVDT